MTNVVKMNVVAHGTCYHCVMLEAYGTRSTSGILSDEAGFNNISYISSLYFPCLLLPF